MELRFFINTKVDAIDCLTVIEKNRDKNDFSYISCDIHGGSGINGVCLWNEYHSEKEMNDYLLNNSDFVELPIEIINHDLIVKMQNKFKGA
jgi:hypothetical protein